MLNLLDLINFSISSSISPFQSKILEPLSVPKTAKELLRLHSSVEVIKSLSKEILMKTVTENQAEAIYKHFSEAK